MPTWTTGHLHCREEESGWVQCGDGVWTLASGAQSEPAGGEQTADPEGQRSTQSAQVPPITTWDGSTDVREQVLGSTTNSHVST